MHGVPSPSGDTFRAWLLLGLLLRGAALPLSGTEDVQVWKTWSHGTALGVATMYGIGGTPPVRGLVRWGELHTTVDYPPATLFGLALVGSAYRLVDPSFTESRALTVVLKLSILLMDALACALLFRLVQRMAGREAARLAALFYWLNPAVILDGAVLGYLDPWMAAPVLGALLAAQAGAGAWCGALLGLALTVKVQAVFAAPVAALLLWHASHRPVRASCAAAVTGAAAIALVLLPFAWRGALPNVAQGVGSLLRHDMLSGTAANTWWIVTWALRASYGAADLGAWTAWTMPVRILGVRRFTELGYPNPRPFGNVAVIGAAGWGFYRAWRGARAGLSPVVLLAAGAFAIHVYFMLAVQVHENHLFLAIPLLAAAAAADPRYRKVAAAISAVMTLNLLLFYGVGRDLPPPPRRLTLVDATVILSIVHVAVFAWHARVLQVVTRRG